MKENTNSIDTYIEDEIKSSYINYAMSVIINRSIPDVRDGLKPVHRRILYSMYKLNNYNNKGYKKSARIVGDVIGKYHPHGDTAVYESIVRMTQKFSLRYPLIDGQGNFGSIDGDSAAAMRYTEIKMSKISHELLDDLNIDIVDYEKNYDGTEMLPKILPVKIPNLLINGSYGIAVGIATNIPSHNLNEVIEGCILLLNNPKSSIEDLNKIIKGPDFATSGIIINKNNSILNVYKKGKGCIIIRSNVNIDKNNRIIITEIPYQVNKINLITSICELIKNKIIEGIISINDESDINGIKIIIEVNKNYSSEIILDNLYKKTQLEINYNINIIALYNNKPKLFNLKNIIENFINYRKELIKNKINYIIIKNLNKINILEITIITIYNTNKIIEIIKESANINEIYIKINNSIINMIKNYKNIDNNIFIKNIEKKYNLLKNKLNIIFTKENIKYILDIKINKLMNIEYEKTLNEYINLTEQNIKFNNILNDNNELNKYIKNELIDINNKYKDIRLTKIKEYNTIMNKNISNINNYNNNNFIIFITKNKYIKRQQIEEYKSQKRLGKGKIITRLLNNDEILNSCIVNITDTLLIFTNIGKVYNIKVCDIPLYNKNNNGKLINTLISIKDDENIIDLYKYNNINKYDYSILITSKGIIKKLEIYNFNKIRSNGLLIIKLKVNDVLTSVKFINKLNDILIFTFNGKSIRLNESKIKITNRNSYGIKSIRLDINDNISSLIKINKNDNILNITLNGFGKITNEIYYNLKTRYTKGIKSIKINNKTGNLIKALNINNKYKFINIITNLGYILKIKNTEIKHTKRNTTGIALIKLIKLEKIIYIYNSII